MSAAFETPVLWVASAHGSITTALRSFLENAGGIGLTHHFAAENALTLRCREELHELFDRQASSVLFNSICILDITHADSGGSEFTFDFARDTNPLRPTELLLRYPEVHWIFVVSSRRRMNAELRYQRSRLADPKLPARAPLGDSVFEGPEDAVNCEILDMHFVPITAICSCLGAIRRHADGFRPILDPTGLRDLMVTLAQSHPCAQTLACEYGLSLEDEVNYCLLNGYVLYRSGRRTYLAPTYREYLNATLRLSRLRGNWDVIEDAELSYADTTIEELRKHYLMPDPANKLSLEQVLVQRGQARLQAASTRKIVSVAKVNCQEIRKSFPSQSIGCVLKPYHGMYDPDLVQKPRAVSGAPATGGAVQSHSAPGRNQEAATHILRRCSRGRDEMRSPENAIHFAVLADVGSQLLHGGTIHMALEALALRHRLEVEAECKFIGTSNVLDVACRLEDIEADVRATIWHGEQNAGKEWKRKQQQCNAMLQICADLRDAYDAYDRREEVDVVLKWYRGWQRRSYLNGLEDWNDPDGVRRMWSYGRRWGRQGAGAIWAYVNFIISSWRRMIAASAVWILAFALLYLIMAQNTMSDRTSRFDMGYWHWCKHSAATFIALQQHLDGGPNGEHMALAFEEASRNCGLKERQMLAVVAGSVNKPPRPTEPLLDAGARRQMASALSEHFAAYLEKEHILRWIKIWWSITMAELVIGFGHAGILIALIVQKFSRK